MNKENLMIFLKLIRESNKRVRKAWNFNLSGPQLHLLNLLESNGHIRMSDLSEELGISQSAATALADRMIKGNYISRARSEDDRRVVKLVITDEGRKLLETFSASRDQALEKFISKLTPEEKAEFVRLCQKMLE
ncbi:MAG: MarR family winged helix-turn-helix transcriptional regulator [Tuberibacillus sp.]